MDALTFKRLPLQQQIEFVRNEGTFIDYKLAGGFIIRLFKIDGFFVEVMQGSSDMSVRNLKAYSVGDYRRGNAA